MAGYRDTSGGYGKENFKKKENKEVYTYLIEKEIGYSAQTTPYSP